MSDMTKPYDGGPAFPVHGGHSPEDDPRNRIMGGGMTLRDWFAGHALACVYSRFEPGADPSAEDIALQAFFIADAMLAERDGINDH